MTGRPAFIKRDIAAAMADGKERTIDDVAKALGADTRGRRECIRRNLRTMAQDGAIVRERASYFVVYRRAAQ